MNRLVGFLLIVSAGLKAWGLFLNPAALLQAGFGQTIIPFVIAAELGIGILALWGTYWRQLRWIGIALFTGFAGYSLWLALHGATSCDCFGPVKVNPWWTLGLDLVIVTGLIAEWWWERRVRTSSPATASLQPNLSPSKNMPSPNLSHEYAGEGQNADPSPGLSPEYRGRGIRLLSAGGRSGMACADAGRDSRSGWGGYGGVDGVAGGECSTTLRVVCW